MKYATAIGVSTENDLFCWSVQIPITGDAYTDKKAAIKALTKDSYPDDTEHETVPERVMLAFNGDGSPDILYDFNVDEQGEPLQP